MGPHLIPLKNPDFRRVDIAPPAMVGCRVVSSIPGSLHQVRKSYVMERPARPMEIAYMFHQVRISYAARNTLDLYRIRQRSGRAESEHADS